MQNTFSSLSLKQILFTIIVCAINPVHAQDKKGQRNESALSEKEERTDLPPYDKIITSRAKSDEGLFNVHKIDDKYFFEISDTLLGREILVVTRISKTANGIGYGGEELNNQVVRWTKKDKKILLRAVSFSNVANDSLPIAQSVRNSNFEPILMVFDIKTIFKDSSFVIEINNLFLKDVAAFGLDDKRRKQYKVMGVDESRSFIESVKSYPINIEARNVLTYKAYEAPSNAKTATISLEINNSFILLPKVPMKPRLMDKRIGYFSISQIDYGANDQRADTRTYIQRWRLEPKESDIQSYLRGELVTPKKQIIYYIDPATPEKWRKYLKLGTEDWNKTFEKAGFKNAIVVKSAPTKDEDPEWSAEDARYSVIRYFASATENAYGPRVSDPRSGEIIESDISWYHNMAKLYKEWYFVQTAAVNPEARKMKLTDEVMGSLIRLAISHEVGHSLGLAHNYAASAAYPVDSLRSALFTAKMGITPSIMDHVRFNYVAQPEDKNVVLQPGIGEYDNYSIKWGYTYLPQMKTPDDELVSLNKLIKEHSGNPIYFFGRQTYATVDPRSQGEDLGNDALKASAYGIANLKKIVPNMLSWTSEAGKDYNNLQDLYYHLVFQWDRFNDHVRANVGGVYENFKSCDQAGNVYTPVPKSIQKEAMLFLNREAFSTPHWLLDKDILRKFEHAGAIERIRIYQAGNVINMLDPSRLARLIEAEAILGKDTYTMLDLFADLRKGLWTELTTGKTIDICRRNLQRSHLEKLESLMKEDQPLPAPNSMAYAGFTEIYMRQSDIRPAVRAELKILRAKILQATPLTADVSSKNHLDYCVQRIAKILDAD
jgi:hypothetical protein